MEQTNDENIDYVFVSSLRTNSHLIHNGRPCKLLDMVTCKTGKHGAAKAIMTVKDIFNDKKHTLTMSTADKIAAPAVVKKIYSLVGITDGYFSLMGEDGNLENSMKCLPDDEMCNQIKAQFEKNKVVEICITHAMNESQITSFTVSD